MTPTLNILTASTRPGRGGPIVAAWAEQVVRDRGGFRPVAVDLADFDLPLLDEPAHPSLQRYTQAHTRRWAESVASADAYLIVTPEYDYFPPASLVNAIQCVLKEWHYKPAGIVSYGGISGGLRATQQLRLLLASVNVHAIPQTVPIAGYREHIADGVFKPTPPMVQGAGLMLDELHKWALALAPLRGGAAKG